MEERQKNNKFWVCLFCFCLVAIAGLTTGIILVNANKTEEVEEMVEEDESQKQYEQYVSDYDLVQNKVAEMLAETPVDIESITKLYKEYIDKYWEQDLFRASTFIDAEIETLRNTDFKRELLDELKNIDFSVFEESEQYRQYAAIAQIANEIGDNEMVNEYLNLADGVKESYMASCRGTEEMMEELGFEVEDANPLCSGIIIGDGA